MRKIVILKIFSLLYLAACNNNSNTNQTNNSPYSNDTRITYQYYAEYDSTIKIAEGIEFPKIDYSIAVRKDDDMLLDKINDGLHKIINDGTHQKLLDKHL